MPAPAARRPPPTGRWGRQGAAPTDLAHSFPPGLPRLPRLPRGKKEGARATAW